MVDRKGESVAPIVRPDAARNLPTVSSRINPNLVKSRDKKKLNSKRKKKKMSRKTQRGALNLRRVFTGFLIVLGMVLGFYLFTNPQTVPSIMNGSFFDRSEVCTVTRTNTTMFFETSCGRFEWKADNVSGSPAANLVEGTAYKFTTHGTSVPISGVYPEVVAVEQP
jgi:hypothetical protein